MRNNRSNSGGDSPREERKNSNKGFFNFLSKLVNTVIEKLPFIDNIVKNIADFFSREKKQGTPENSTTQQEEKKEMINNSSKEPPAQKRTISDPDILANSERLLEKIRSQSDRSAEMPKAERTTTRENTSAAPGRAGRS